MGIDYEPKPKERVLFRPNPGPQTSFLSAPQLQVLYGGAAGGGKSFAMLADPIRYFSHPKFNGLLVRRTTEELRELIRESKGLYGNSLIKGKWSDRDKTWTFPSGAQLWMSFLERDEDVLRYQGQSFTWIGFDELTQWPTPYPWNYMMSRLRTTAPDLPLSQRASTNPGGPGHCLPFGEVLTKDGWKDIKSCRVGDVVYSLDKTGAIVEKTISDTVKEYYKGNMVSRKGQMVFTENHRIPFKSHSGKVEIRPFHDLPGQVQAFRAGEPLAGRAVDFTVPEYTTRKLRLNQPDHLNSKDFAELMGWFLSEGHTVDRDKAFGISQIKEPQKTQIRELLARAKFSFGESGTGFLVHSPKWWNYFKTFGKCRDKFIPKELFSSSNLRDFFYSLMAGDGHWYSDNSGTYYTTSEKLADDVAQVCVLLGYSVKVSKRQRKGRKGMSYEVHFTNRLTTELNTGNHIYSVETTSKSTNVEKTYFEGWVYCITVPDTETFFVRQDGYVWVSGNTWVKKMFIDPAPPGESFWATDIETGEVMVDLDEDSPDYGKPLFKRRFIPAALKDNPYLTRDGAYRRTLMAMPEHQRRQLLYGDWDVAEGAAFSEWNRDIHTVEPFDIPNNWIKFRACDYGYGSYTGVLWFAVEPKTEKIYVYRELYVSKVLAVDLADMILNLERDDGIIRYGVLDSSLWHRRGDPGPSLAEQMIARGCRWRPSDRSKGSRVAGKNEIHRRLQIDEWTGEPRLQVFDTCTNFIAHFPAIPVDKKNPEDVDTEYQHDHLYDALRYGLMSRPRSGLFDFDSFSSREDFTPADSTFGY